MLRSMLVRDYMTKDVLTLSPDMEVLRAAHALLRKKISGAPVIDKHGRLVGMLTERDCMKVALDDIYHGIPGDLVRDHMSSDPQWVAPGESILKLAEMFINGRFHRYPVLDNGRLVGIISRSDVMQAMGKHYPN